MSGDNGKLTRGEQAIQDGKVCATCTKHAPEDVALILLQAPKPASIVQPQGHQGKALMACACGNPKSPNYQHILLLTGSCDEHVAAPPKVAVPDKIADRMKG